MQQNTTPLQFVRRIAIDDRERGSGVIEALRDHPNVELTVRRLKLGDYLIDKTLIVERKTLADFALSVVDGRLFTQASRLARTNRARPCFILEGVKEDHPNLVISRPAMQGAIIALTLVFGLPLFRSKCPRETADLILLAADQLQRRNSTAPKRQGYHPKGLARQQSFLLQAIPEIGPTKARRLLDAFGSPFGVASARVEDLQAVDGIGESASKKIRRVFRGD
jgi:DNA excision repair protein ERCC-4